MKIDEYDFGFIAVIEPTRGDDGIITQMMPQERYKNARNLPLNKYGVGPFCKFNIPANLRLSGVYAITTDDNLQYVGECANFSQRFNAGYGNISPKNCFKGGQETNCRLNNLIYSAAIAGKCISLWFHQTQDYKAVEAALRAKLRPNWNRV